MLYAFFGSVAVFGIFIGVTIYRKRRFDICKKNYRDYFHTQILR